MGKYVMLVCGGRNYADRKAVFNFLDYHHHKQRIGLLVTGSKKGADGLACAWADSRKVKKKVELADWDLYGITAGPIRNGRMLVLYDPDGVCAFPGGTGTADMIRRADAAGIPIYKYAEWKR